MSVPRVSFFDDLPMLDDPIIAHEPTDHGWRGLTAHGEIIDVRGQDGHKPAEPDSAILVLRGGQAVGRRAVEHRSISIDQYLAHFNTGIELFCANACEPALSEFDKALAIAPNARAEFNRALVLLTLGRWAEGLPGYESRLRLLMPWTCQEAAKFGPRWRGEALRDKRLLLVHDAGFGDTIQQLRYVPALINMGAEVALLMPPELRRFAAQAAPNADNADGFDFWCPMLSLLHLLRQTIETVPDGPYLTADPELVEKWSKVINEGTQHNIGIAWSVGRDVEGDYPRAIPLEPLVKALPGEASLWSMQQQEQKEAADIDVEAVDFEDFADCAALMSLMDEVVTVDTAAAHVAGAIGHPQVTVLLSHWASWRWHRNPFYPWFKLCSQAAPGDWASALARL
jgi:hypothetical protein